MRSGASTISKVYAGTGVVSRIYSGATIVYDAGTFAWNLTGTTNSVDVTWSGNPTDFTLAPTASGATVTWSE